MLPFTFFVVFFTNFPQSENITIFSLPKFTFDVVLWRQSLQFRGQPIFAFNLGDSFSFDVVCLNIVCIIKCLFWRELYCIGERNKYVQLLKINPYHISWP